MEKESINSSGKDLEAIRRLCASPLPVAFYLRNTLDVAKDLLGKILLVKSRLDLPLGHPDSGLTAGRIVETEAYRSDDPASHSARGKTPRSSIMFGHPGVAYVYFIYGMYEMFNLVTEPEHHPGAVLIRAVEPLYGYDLMKKRRKGKSRLELTVGPGRLCQALGIQMSHNGQPLQGPSLFVGDDGYVPQSISRSPRIGIRVGTDKLWRFFLTNHSFVSRARQNWVQSPF